MSIFQLGCDEIYYEQYGAGAECVVFLNGIMMNTASWASHASILGSGRKVLLNDFIGQGRSTKVDKTYTYDMHVDHLIRLLDYLEVDQAHFVGTSYGAEVGMALAIQHCRRVKSLTLAAATSETDALMRAKVRVWQIAARQAVEHGTKSDFFRTCLPFNYSSEFLERKSVLLEDKAREFVRVPNEWFTGLDRLCECFLTLNLTQSLPKIHAPVLIIAGSRDELKPVAFSRIMANAISGSVMEIIDAGHALVVERPDVFTSRVADFIAKN